MSTDFVNSLIDAQRTSNRLKSLNTTAPVQYSYADIKDLQDHYAQQPGSLLGDIDTGSFSRLLQANDPQGDYSLGTNPGIIKDASNQVHRLFRNLGVNQLGSDVGGGIGGFLGGEKGRKVGEKFGESLGRSTVQTVAFLGGLSLGGVGGAALAGAALADAGARLCGGGSG